MGISGRLQKRSSPEAILISLSERERFLNDPLSFTTPWQQLVNYLAVFVDTEQVLWVS